MKRKLIGTITERDFNWTVLINNGTVKWPLNPLVQWNRIYITQPVTPFFPLFWRKKYYITLGNNAWISTHIFISTTIVSILHFTYIQHLLSDVHIVSNWYPLDTTIHAEILNVRYSTLEIKLCGLFYKPFPSYTIEHLFMEMQYTFISSFKSAYLAC